MNDYLFFFGRTPNLSWVELLVFFPGATKLFETVAVVSEKEFQSKDRSPDEWIRILGGVTKISRVVTRLPYVATPADLASVVSDARVPGAGTLTFGVSTSEADAPIPRHFLEKMKQILASDDHRVRFIESRHGNALTSVVIAKNDIIDIVLLKVSDGYSISRTLAVQDFESWSQRDYGRPHADPKAGMLPPKVARMAVNIAGTPGGVLLDPFCGMGTVLAEALLLGWCVKGSDQSEEVVEKAKLNLEWLEKLYLHGKVAIFPDMKLFVSDATHVSEYLKPESINAIVTEPYMGPTIGENDKFRMTNDKLKNVIKGLEKLYLGCLKDWHPILKTGGRVVIALPEYKIEDKMFFVKKVIDRCENLGYTKLHGPVEYGRPQAIVRREFYVFEKT
ncbi:hypothetical protein HY948_04145 [Candidatus Gottesmanbacteria bacterium]|nr:hypothetical protein [Candidatus Gottesmanbacteria bacterium]